MEHVLARLRMILLGGCVFLIFVIFRIPLSCLLLQWSACGVVVFNLLFLSEFFVVLLPPSVAI